MALIEELGLTEQVSMPGRIEDVEPLYRAADIFCIPSRFEGHPLVLLEANAHEVPGVGFAHCSGVNDIIVHGENGLLAPKMTPESLAGTLAELMADPERVRAMGKRAREMMDRYDPDTVFDRMEALLEKAADCRGFTAMRRLEVEQWTPESLMRAASDIFREDYERMDAPRYLDDAPEPPKSVDLTRMEFRWLKVYAFPSRAKRYVQHRLAGKKSREAWEQSSDTMPKHTLSDDPEILAAHPWSWASRRDRFLTPGQYRWLLVFWIPKWTGQYLRKRAKAFLREFKRQVEWK